MGISKEFPEIIETERLLIRSPRPGDGAEVNAAIRETFNDLHFWMDWADHLPTVEETEKHCQRAHANFVERKDFPLGAYLKVANKLVVRAGLHLRDWKVPKFEIGYWCRASFQGQGYVTETVRAITHAGFKILKANRIEIRCDPRNVRSRRVAERAGYRLEAELKNDKLAPDGSLRNTLIFALLPDDFGQIKETAGQSIITYLWMLQNITSE